MKPNTDKSQKLFCLRAALLLFCLTSLFASAQRVSVDVQVSSQQVYVGDGFQLRIRVQGTEKTDRPEIEDQVGSDFKAEYVTEKNTSKTSVTIINGRTRKQVMKQYIFIYELTALKQGNLVLPQLTIDVKGGTYKTQSINIYAREPKDMKAFKLRLAFDKQTCYVGEPVKLDIHCYFSANIQELDFNLPVLSSTDWFAYQNIKPTNVPRSKLLRLPLSDDKTVIGYQHSGVLDNREYSVVTFSQLLIPKKSGRFQAEENTMAVYVKVGRGSAAPFPGFDDFFGNQSSYKRFVLPGNDLQLQVKPLPEANKPDGFTGIVGKIALETTATPVKVKVGDPITFNITVSGDAFLQRMELPPLTEQDAFNRDFKIPQERAEGTYNEDAEVKRFSQTIRAKHAEVDQIPPIRIPYFDADKGTYEFAESNPIPLTVEETRVVTAADAFGGSDGMESSASQVASFKEGIRHNYAGQECLMRMYAAPFRMFQQGALSMAAIAPPLLYLVSLLAQSLSRLKHVRESERSRQAKRLFDKAMKQVQGDENQKVLNALRVYFGAKFDVNSSTLTFAEIEQYMQKCNIDDKIQQEAKALFEDYEMSQYAGGAFQAKDGNSLTQRANAIVDQIEKSFRKND
jgi:hypothetical protein